MIDINHTFGGDLSVSPNGDIATVSGTTTGQQRVLRRLLTNPTDYIWDLIYGGGLARMVGSPSRPIALRGLIRSQLGKEAAVAPIPEPVVTVASTPNGVVTTGIRYVDAQTGLTQVMNLPAGT